MLRRRIRSYSVGRVTPNNSEALTILPLARANAMVLESSKPVTEQPSELDAGLESLGGDEWKKKNIYD